jgi:glycerophosphoryl diester phosphodiesterase
MERVRFLINFGLSISVLFTSSWAATAPKIEIYGHRGARSWEPENSLPSYEAALRAGVDWVDLDVLLSKDGRVVVSHDLVLNPDITRDAQGLFLSTKIVAKNLNLRQLQVFDVGRISPLSSYGQYFPWQIPRDGIRMPTLEEVIHSVKQVAGDSVRFQIEMKTDPVNPDISPDPKALARALYKILRQEKIVTTVEVQAFDFRCLYALQKLDPRIHTAYLTSRDNERGGVDDFFHSDPGLAGRWTGGKLVKDYGSSMPRMIRSLGGSVWGPEDAQLTYERLLEAHELGLKVVVWTWPEKSGSAFDETLVRRMLDWGVDGIITDDPARLRTLLEAEGRPVPPRLSMGAPCQNPVRKSKP